MRIVLKGVAVVAAAATFAVGASSASADNAAANSSVSNSQAAPAAADQAPAAAAQQGWLSFSQLASKTMNPANPDAPAAPMGSGSSHSGCVGNYSSVGDDFISWNGNMVGCSRGNLHLHTWLERNGSLYIDGTSNDCGNTTSCTTASHTWYSRPSSGTWVTVVHGWNSTTGGSNYARLTVAVVP